MILRELSEFQRFDRLTDFDILTLHTKYRYSFISICDETVEASNKLFVNQIEGIYVFV